MSARLTYVAADESQLNLLLEGEPAGTPAPWAGGAIRQRVGRFGVLLDDRKPNQFRPCAIVAQSSEFGRLFSRYSTLRSDLSPLSAWCYIFEPEHFDWLKDPLREADLYGMTGAWTGLAIAEALLLAERPLSQLRLAACQSTQTFAVARMHALWERVGLDDTLGWHSEAIQLFNGRDDRRVRLEEHLRPIWETLLAAGGRKIMVRPGFSRIVQAIRTLEALRQAERADEAYHLRDLFIDLPEAQFLGDLAGRSPEDRVRAFDTLVKQFLQVEKSAASRRLEIVFLAGYLATVVAGGSASLSLTSESAKSIPEITAWAYLIGGIGERVLWTSGFEGLGRLVSRELERPFHADETPVSDIALSEARVLVDRDLSDPLVRLRIKQTRVAIVSLVPGVNIAVSLKEAVNSEERRTVQTPLRQQPEVDVIALLADALWPRIEALLDQRERSDISGSRLASRRRKTGQNKLL